MRFLMIVGLGAGTAIAMGHDALAQVIIDQAADDMQRLSSGVGRVGMQVAELAIMAFALVGVVTGKINWKMAIVGVIAMYAFFNAHEFVAIFAR